MAACPRPTSEIIHSASWCK